MLCLHKMGERPDLGDWIEKYQTSWKRAEYWREINAGVKVTAVCLGELTTEGEKEAKHGSLFEMTELEK